MTPSISDADLLALARQGDQQAADRLLASNRERLRRMVGARMDARLVARFDPSDVVQEALMEASQRLPTFLEKNDDMFYPWLRAIAWERLIQRHRQHIAAKKRSVQREAYGGLQLNNESATEFSRQLAASISTPSAAAVRNELQRRVHSFLEELPDKDKEVLLLRHLEHLTMREVAAALDISLSAAKSRYFRAIERLHQLVGEGPLQ